MILSFRLNLGLINIMKLNHYYFFSNNQLHKQNQLIFFIILKMIINILITFLISSLERVVNKILLSPLKK